MTLYFLRIVISAVLILVITELTKRFGFVGALVASLPFISILSMVWIYLDTRDAAKIASFSIQVFWFVLPSLGMFLSLPWLLHRFSFAVSLTMASLITISLFGLMLLVFKAIHYNPLG